MAEKGSCGTFTPAPPTPTPTEPTWQAQVFDQRLVVILTEIEATSDLGRDYDVPPAEEGKEYLVFHLTVERIVDTYLVEFCHFGRERAALINQQDNSYEARFASFSGVEFENPTNIASSSWFVEGAERILVFEVSEGTEPSVLGLIYGYKESLEQESAQRGEMSIDL